MSNELLETPPEPNTRIERSTRTYAHTEMVYLVDGRVVASFSKEDTWLEDENVISLTPEELEDETGVTIQ